MRHAALYLIRPDGYAALADPEANPERLSSLLGACPQRVAAWFFPKFTDNCNVSVNKLADEVVAYTETRMPIRFDPDTLNTLGEYDYDEQIKGSVSIAHPHIDHARGRHYTYLLEFGRKSKYHLLGIDQATGQEAVVATLPAERPAYIHSFGMSERYLVLAEFPLVVPPPLEEVPTVQ